jgi:LTR polyprotein gag-polypeptide-like protein
MGKDRLYLPKLMANSVNWITYHNRIQWSIKMRDLGNHLIYKTVMTVYQNTSNISGVFPAQRWARKKITTSGLLDTMIPNKVFQNIKNYETVMKVWAQLKVLFEGKLRSVMVNLGRKFQTMCYGKNDDVCAHFNKLTHLCEKLSALGRAVGNDKYVAVLIGSLPSCYDSPINSLTFSCDINNIDITHTTVIYAATCEYEKCVLYKENKAQDEAFTTATEANKKANKKEVECFNCKKKGHYKLECWAKGGGKEGEGLKKPRNKDKNGKDHANTTETETLSLEDESWVVIVEINNVPS